MAENKEQRDLTEKADRDRIGGGPGAGDANGGAGNATGTPEDEAARRAGEVVNRGDAEEPLKRHGDKLEAQIPRQPLADEVDNPDEDEER